MENFTLTDGATVREYAFEVRAAYDRARPNSGRWQELETTFGSAKHRLTHAASVSDADKIRRDAIEAITSIAALDLADKAREQAKARKAADDIRFEAQRLAYAQAWRDRVTKHAVAAINEAITEFRQASVGMTGVSADEADVRKYLSDIADAATALRKRIEFEVRESINRETDAARKAS
jgi:hypothetical protein